MLAVLGGAFGLLLAWFAVHLLRVAVAERLSVQRLEGVSLDGAVLAFTIVASMVSGIFFGLVPALSASGSALTDALKDGGRGGSAARGKRTRAVFVVAEVALALVLLVGAGLLVRSFIRLTNVNPGFDAGHTLSLRVGLPMSEYRENGRRVQFYDRLFERIDALPGVTASGGTSFFPLASLGAATGFSVVGHPEPRPGEGPVCDVRVVANDYFTSMRVPLVMGRVFVENDPSENSHRVLVNEALARQYFPGENPLGRRLKISWGENVEDEIVGVVGDVRQATLDKDARPTIYWPYGRLPYPTMTLAVRTGGEPLSMASSIVRIVHQLDPNLAVADIRTVDEVVSDSLAQQRVIMLLLTIFAVAALALAAVGIYGVISYSVSQRTQEIGIRMALGAERAQVLWTIVGQALALAATGIAIGAAAAFLLTRLMTGLLFGVAPDDPVTFAAVAAVLAGVAAAASYVPGRRATRVDPVVALRAE